MEMILFKSFCPNIYISGTNVYFNQNATAEGSTLVFRVQCFSSFRQLSLFPYSGPFSIGIRLFAVRCFLLAVGPIVIGIS